MDKSPGIGFKRIANSAEKAAQISSTLMGGSRLEATVQAYAEYMRRHPMTDAQKAEMDAILQD